MIAGPLKWYTVAEGLVTAVQAALTTPVGRACVVPGAIAWDSGDCGLLAASIVRVSPSNEFPVIETMPLGNCAPVLEVAEIVLQVMRCAPGIGEAADQVGALAPDCADLDASAQEVQTDTYWIMKSVTAYLVGLRDSGQIIDYFQGDAVIMGPEGGVVGNEMRILAGLPYGC